jgi:hypothetical protein
MSTSTAATCSAARCSRPRSVDTTLTFALTHEIWSYGSGSHSVRRFAEAIFEHTVPGGVWINSDVCGPHDPGRTVHLTLRTDDGGNPPKPRPDLSDLSREEVTAHVAGLSTRARLDQFAVDFRFPLPFTALDEQTVELPLGAAMDFLTRKDYADNWLSEAHEQFCGLSFDGWVALLTTVGFDVEPASHVWRNEWIVDHRLRPMATLRTPDGALLDWPVTHTLLVARRPVVQRPD